MKSRDIQFGGQTVTMPTGAIYLPATPALKDDGDVVFGGMLIHCGRVIVTNPLGFMVWLGSTRSKISRSFASITRWCEENPVGSESA